MTNLNGNGGLKNAATQAVAALKGTPLLLMLLLFNGIWLSALTYSSIKHGDRWERVAMRALQACQGIQ